MYSITKIPKSSLRGIPYSFNLEDRTAVRKWGTQLEKNGYNEEATILYKKAIDIDPKNGWAWRDMGRALETLGKNEEALKAYKKALEIDPCNTFVNRDRLAVLEKLDKDNQARKAGSQQLISYNTIKSEKKTEDKGDFSLSSLRPRKKLAIEQNKIEIGKLPPHDKKIQEGY